MRLLGCETGVRTGIHQPAVLRERLAHPIEPQRRAMHRLHHDLHGQMVFFREFVIALIVRRHAHHRAGSILRQHEIRHPDRQLFARKWIHGESPGEKPFFFGGGDIRGAHAFLPHGLELRFHRRRARHAFKQTSRKLGWSAREQTARDTP